MAKEHDDPRPEILELHFKPEGYVSPSGSEFLDKFSAMLTERGLNPADFVYSGFSAKKIHPVNGMPRDPVVYVMNIPGWSQAIEEGIPTPADYAMDDFEPCIAVYDKNQLAEVIGATHLNFEDVAIHGDPVKLDVKEKGDNLADMKPEKSVSEEVVHKNFPDGSPTDALVALVHIDEE